MFFGEHPHLDNSVIRESIQSSVKVTHLWYLRLTPTLDVQLLSDAEKEKAKIFRFSQDMERYIFSRRMLRILLGYYLLLPPEKIRIVADGDGREHVSQASYPFRFNISHSGDVSVFGFTNRVRIGVDVERMREVENLDDIASKLFSVDDLLFFRGLSRGERAELFFRAWTAREAAFKAFGGRLDDYAVRIGGLGPKKIYVDNGDFSSGVYSIIVDEYCCAAVIT
jgi:4'-phosphopantetheinyl transferase